MNYDIPKINALYDNSGYHKTKEIKDQNILPYKFEDYILILRDEQLGHINGNHFDRASHKSKFLDVIKSAKGKLIFKGHPLNDKEIIRGVNGAEKYNEVLFKRKQKVLELIEKVLKHKPEKHGNIYKKPVKGDKGISHSHGDTFKWECIEVDEIVGYDLTDYLDQYTNFEFENLKFVSHPHKDTQAMLKSIVKMPGKGDYVSLKSYKPLEDFEIDSVSMVANLITDGKLKVLDIVSLYPDACENGPAAKRFYQVPKEFQKISKLNILRQDLSKISQQLQSLRVLLNYLTRR